MAAEKKTCKTCNEDKPLWDFQINTSVPGEYHEDCKACRAEKRGAALKQEMAARKAKRVAKKKAAADKKKEIAVEKSRAASRKYARKPEVKARVAERNKERAAEERLAAKRIAAREHAARKMAAQRAESQEYARRILAKKRLIHYVKRFHPNYLAGWVHHDICRRLERFAQEVAEQKSPRLMIFVPPRHGKSELASNNFPSWVLGHHPEFEIIAASYNVSLPMGFSRKVRERILDDKAYTAMFPDTKLRKDSQSAEAWGTTCGGGYVAAGVGGGITGKGAHILIIDDPVKDSEEADSENQRQKVWDWYGSTAYTRLAPGGGVLVIQTRWHDDDLAGRLVAQMREDIKEGVPEEEIDSWEIIEYPALATEEEWLNKDGTITSSPKLGGTATLLRRKGEALHPDRFPEERLKAIKRTLQPRHWSALYQQNPVPDEGMYFTKSMFRYFRVPQPLSEMKIYAAWDLAIGEKEQNDYTVGVVGGVDCNDQLFILDVVRFKGDAFAIVEAILNVYQKYTPELTGIEKGQLEHAIRPQLKKRMSERRLFPTLAEGKKALMPVGDKRKRARPLQGRMQQGMVYINESQPWAEDLIHEMLRFDGGVHDDQVDALAWLVRMTMNEDPPKPPKAKQHKSWKDKLGQYVGGTASQNPMAA